MKITVAVLVVALGSCLVAGDAGAQEPSPIGIQAAAVLSLQPVDPTYVGAGGPYLDRGLGGLGPGASLGLTVAAKRLALAFEYSTAWISVQQTGRLVNGGAGVGRLHDSMLTALVGVRQRSGRSEVRWLGGGGYLMGTPTSNGVPRRDLERSPSRSALTLGADVITAIGPRVGLLVTGRVYRLIRRDESVSQLGVGRNVFRFGVGLSITP